MEIPKEYPLAVGMALAMNLQLFYYGFAAGRARIVFNQQFMKKYWGDQHKLKIGEDIQSGGFPDTGSGVYSKELSYKDWFEFNVKQRTHLNYVQNINLATTTVLAAGLYKPRQAAVLGLIYIVGRALYATGYTKLKKLRGVGFGLTLLALLGNIGLFAYNLKKHWN